MQLFRNPKHEASELSMQTQIVNVVATTRVDQKVDLTRLGKFPGCSYNQRTYNGKVAYVKTPHMSGKVSIFSTGRMISVGTKSEEEAKSDLLFACRLLEKTCLVKVKREEIHVQNVVALVTTPWKLDLELLALEQPHAIYEPDQFPGAIIRFEAYPEITVLAFSSGKLIIAGAKSALSVESIANELTTTLKGKIPVAT